MSAPQPISKEVKEELNMYTCGYDGAVKVCCPPGPIRLNSLQRTDDGDLENPPPPPDVTNHMNFRLLPQDCGYLASGDKIRNGKDARLHEFPWMALLSYSTSKRTHLIHRVSPD
ncbi:hypothetical protein NQ318_004013 [Aromia moschata]|uniref:Uncharacterized protein n=1 Tax=Aromia moschata TaxID=1265417 RepID=A0AAV8Z7T1_9CUCU|nr:hypothetical protein NQ318_004013 [Aromia moschata]